MTLTVFLDVNDDVAKHDETKLDLLKDNNGADVMSKGLDVNQTETADEENLDLATGTERPPAHYVKVTALRSSQVARRRRFMYFILVIIFCLLVAIGCCVGVLLSLHSKGAREETEVACKVRFRNEEGRDKTSIEVSIGDDGRLLLRPTWDPNGSVTMYDHTHGFSVMVANKDKKCVLSGLSPNLDSFVEKFVKWMKTPYKYRVPSGGIVWLHYQVTHPAISEREVMMTYGLKVWAMCRGYTILRVTPVAVAYYVTKGNVRCPLITCVPCPSGNHVSFNSTCATCLCGIDSDHRRRRSAPEPQERQLLRIDGGVLPDEEGRGIHTINLIEF